MKKITLILTMILGLSTFGQVPTYVPTSGLVGWWPFSGNSNDVSGNGNNATNLNATLTTDRDGNTNSSYLYNGTNAKMTLPNLGNFSEFSYSIWVESNGSNGLLLRAFLGNDGWVVGNIHNNVTTTNMNVIIAGYNSIITNTYTLDTPDWHHIVYTYENNDTARLYINGIEVESLVGTSGTKLFNNLNLGYAHNDARYWNGKIDDFGFWNRVLTPTEVTALYSTTLSITDVSYNNTIKVYPNPTNDQITIDNGNISNMIGYSMEIKNSLGQSVFQSTINQQQFTLNIGSWTGSGLYFLYLTDTKENVVSVKKIVIQ